MLFLQGTRHELAKLELLQPLIDRRNECEIHAAHVRGALRGILRVGCKALAPSPQPNVRVKSAPAGCSSVFRSAPLLRGCARPLESSSRSITRREARCSQRIHLTMRSHASEKTMRLAVTLRLSVTARERVDPLGEQRSSCGVHLR